LTVAEVPPEPPELDGVSRRAFAMKFVPVIVTDAPMSAALAGV
jgi:hypothetical protein